MTRAGRPRPALRVQGPAVRFFNLPLVLSTERTRAPRCLSFLANLLLVRIDGRLLAKNLLGDDVIAEPDALVADAFRRPSDEPFHLVPALAAERAAQLRTGRRHPILIFLLRAGCGLVGPEIRSLCLLGEDVVGELDALVADVDRRTGDQLPHLALVLPAESALQDGSGFGFSLHALSAGLRLQGGTARAKQPHSRMLRIRIGRRWTRERGNA